MIIIICKNKVDLHIYIYIHTLYNCNLLMLLYINKILTRTVLLLGPGMVGTGWDQFDMGQFVYGSFRKHPDPSNNYSTKLNIILCSINIMRC